jgi:hypothetical protein
VPPPGIGPARAITVVTALGFRRRRRKPTPRRLCHHHLLARHLQFEFGRI